MKNVTQKCNTRWSKYICIFKKVKKIWWSYFQYNLCIILIKSIGNTKHDEKFFNHNILVKENQFSSYNSGLNSMELILVHFWNILLFSFYVDWKPERHFVIEKCFRKYVCKCVGKSNKWVSITFVWNYRSINNL